MALNDSARQNFTTMQNAFANGDVALVECIDKATGNTVPVMCAVQYHDNDEVEMVPLAKMFAGNPYDELGPPE